MNEMNKVLQEEVVENVSEVADVVVVEESTNMVEKGLKAFGIGAVVYFTIKGVKKLGAKIKTVFKGKKKLKKDEYAASEDVVEAVEVDERDFEVSEDDFK